MEDKAFAEIAASLERIASALEDMLHIEKERERMEKKDRGMGGLET